MCSVWWRVLVCMCNKFSDSTRPLCESEDSILDLYMDTYLLTKMRF
jgi:hypothetical protein